MKGEAPKRCKIIIMDAPVATFPCSSRESSLASSQSSSRDQSLSRPSFDDLSLRSSSLDTSYYHRASSLNSSQTSSSLHASYSSLAPTTKSRNFNSSNGDLVSTPFSRSLSTKRLSLIKNNSSLIMTATDLPSTTDVLCKTSLARATRPMEELPMRNLKPLEQVKLIDREGQVKILRTRFEKLIGEDEFYHDHDTNDRDKMDGESKISDNYFHDIDCGDSQQNESDHNDIEGKGHENENIALSEIEQKEHQQNQKSHHRLQTRQQRLRRLREKRLKSIKKKRRFHKLCHDITAPPDPTPLKRELVLVYGPYGCGKKALVKHALKDLVGGCHDCENGKVDCNANNGTDAGNGRNASGNGKNGWFITGTFEKNYFDKKANANGKGEIHSGNDHPRKRRAAIGTTVNVRFEDEGASLCSDLNDPLGSVSTPFSGILSACRHICTELLILRSSEETIEASDRNTNGHSNAEESNTIEQESGESPAEGKGGGVRWDMSHLFEETREELKQALNIEDCQVLVSQGLRDLATILDLSLDINGDIAIDKDATNVADNDDSFQLVRSGSNGSRRESNIIRRASNNRNSNLSTTSLDLDGAQKQLHIAFQKFFRVISQLHGPLVVVLDALQFADTSSLDLFEALLMDREIADLMVVGCVRTEDVPEDRRRSNDSRNSPTSHVSSRQKKCANEKLIVRIGKWKKKAETCGLSITEVAVGNLDLKGTDEFITNLMSLEDVDDSLPLSEVCHQRTRGNPLFLYKFLHLLWREKLIEFNMGCHRWEWDLENIASRTVVTHNALELLLRDFSHLSKEVRSVLVLSSCLGSCFSERCLFLVWDKMGVNSYLHQGDRTKIRQILAKAEEKQFIERVTDGTYKLRAGRHYRWTHDRIMDLAISNVPDDALCALRFEVGSTLFNALNEVELEEVIFTVANLVNSGGRSVLGSLEGSRRLQLARLNLLAARRAVELSAFNSAARYANAGVELLPNRRRWKDPSKELMLELSSISAEVAGSLSRRRDLERWCEEILCRNELTIHDKLRAYICLIDSMGKNECPDQAVDLCRVVLENLDCVFTKNQVGRDEEAMSERLEAIAKITHDDEYMQLVIDLPLMDDREKLQSMTILTRLCGYFMILQDKQSFAMIVSRMARWTFHYGLSLESPVVFAYYAISFIIRGDFAAGALNGWIALSLLEEFSNRKAKARTIFLVWYYVLPWSRHIRDSERPLIAGYHFATDCGDTRMSFFCIFGKIIADLISGRPLRQIDDVCRAFVPQIAQSELVGTLMRILWQTVLNLIGQCEDVNKLVGEGWNEEELALEESPHSSYVKNHFKAFKSYLYLFNGEHELSVDLAMERQDQFLEDIPGSALGLIDLISRGMPLFDAAQRTKKKRYINASNKIRKTCKTWLQNGNGVGSVVHHGMLFDAEKAILEGKVEDAKDLYKRGIAFASRAGFVQDAALLHERYATFLLSRKINSEEARYHLERAIIFYQEWGAQSRVQFIKQRVSAQL